MGQGKAGDALLVCKCLFQMEGNKAVILSEVKTGMYLSHFCQTCAAGEDVTWGAQHPGRAGPGASEGWQNRNIRSLQIIRSFHS